MRNMDSVFRAMSCPRIFSLHSVTAAELHTASSQERKEFNPDSPKYQTLLVRQYIEMEYWKRYGIDFRIVLRENLNKTLAVNIEHCMAYYDPAHVQGEEAMLKYLVAHKAVSVPMDRKSYGLQAW